MDHFENYALRLTCPDCGYRFNELLSRLELHPKQMCMACGSTFEVDASPVRQEVEKAKQGLLGALGAALPGDGQVSARSRHDH